MVQLSVVIPSYNHAHFLVQSVPAIRSFLQGRRITAEIIIVDDGSTERIPNISGCRIITNTRNRGKGYSLRRGMQEARGEYLLLTDADLAVPMTEFGKLWKHCSYDLVLASRNLPGAQVSGVTASRRVLGSIFPRLARLLLGVKIKDTQCGFKFMRRSRVIPLLSRCTVDGFAFDAELVLAAERNHLRIKEVPITWHAKPDSRVRITYHPFIMLAELISVAIRQRFRRYDG